MNHKSLWTLILCMPVFVLLAGCQSEPIIPVTGAESMSIPSAVELARDHALAYVVSCPSFETVPLDGNWQLDGGESADGKYCFHNGDWTLFVWDMDGQKEYQRVALSNKALKAFWWGYVTDDGHVVDTTYMP